MPLNYTFKIVNFMVKEFDLNEKNKSQADANSSSDSWCPRPMGLEAIWMCLAWGTIGKTGVKL